MDTTTYTPAVIKELAENEIFVFGSNIDGMHYGGAARTALKWGAIIGQGVGLQGQTYAIPTMGGSIEGIRPFIEEFIEFAKNNRQYTFLVTRIGCGIAGYKVEDIAPLFSTALEEDNIILPKDFVECINTDLNIFLSPYIQKKIYGQTRTLVDMLVELNVEKKYTSAEDALSDLEKVINRMRTSGDEVAFNCSVRSLWAFSQDCFNDGKLNVEQLSSMLEHGHYKGLYAVYKDYVIEKTITLIKYLNNFRRYKNSKDLIDDFMKATGGVSSCSPNPPDYYYAFRSPSGGNYIWYYLSRYIGHFWKEIAPQGILNNKLLQDFMYGRHDRGIKKYGLPAVIKRNYKEDSACHPEVLFPYKGGAAPIYVKHKDTSGYRKYTKSCGEGKGPNYSPDWFEFSLIERLLAEDEKYVAIEDYYIPKNDYTLPVYYYYGMVSFNSMNEKIAFIKSKLDE